MNADAFFDDLSTMQPTPAALLANKPDADFELRMLNAGLHDICADLRIPKSQAESLDPAQVASTFREMARAIEARDELAEQEAAEEEADYQEQRRYEADMNRASRYV